MTYKVERLGDTTFVLRPDYDATVAKLGYEPPLGIPVECTFNYAWQMAEQKVARERRASERRARLAAEQGGAKPAPLAAAPQTKAHLIDLLQAAGFSAGLRRKTLRELQRMAIEQGLLGTGE